MREAEQNALNDLESRQKLEELQAAGAALGTAAAGADAEAQALNNLVENVYRNHGAPNFHRRQCTLTQRIVKHFSKAISKIDRRLEDLCEKFDRNMELQKKLASASHEMKLRQQKEAKQRALVEKTKRKEKEDGVNKATRTMLSKLQKAVSEQLELAMAQNSELKDRVERMRDDTTTFMEETRGKLKKVEKKVSKVISSVADTVKAIESARDETRELFNERGTELQTMAEEAKQSVEEVKETVRLQNIKMEEWTCPEPRFHDRERHSVHCRIHRGRGVRESTKCRFVTVCASKY